jgi:hypothetical protein
MQSICPGSLASLAQLALVGVLPSPIVQSLREQLLHTFFKNDELLHNYCEKLQTNQLLHNFFQKKWWKW